MASILRSFFFGLFSCCMFTCISQNLFTYPLLEVEYTKAATFRKLKLIPIRQLEPCSPADDSATGSFLSLQGGLRSGKIVIRERGNYMVENIHTLLIENRSSQALHIKSGELVIGGYQDRVFAKDTILPPSDYFYEVPVYCIEENRWSNKAKKFRYGGNSSSGLQWIIDSSKKQHLVWDEIRTWVENHNQKSSSFASLFNNKRLADSTQAYVRYFTENTMLTDSTVVGLIAISGNRILGADVLLSPALFSQALPHLLEKYSLEAHEKGSPPVMNQDQEILFANKMLSGSTQPEFLNKRGKRVFYKGSLIQISAH